jgi:hypothetical protein
MPSSGSCKNRRFRGTHHLHRQQLLITANAVPNSLILSTLMIKAIHSSEKSVLKTATGLHIPECGILHSHRREHLNSYKALTGWAL